MRALDSLDARFPAGGRAGFERVLDVLKLIAPERHRLGGALVITKRSSVVDPESALA